MTQRRIAQYKQIENDLLQKINLGYYKKDDLIPTELELSNTYHVSRVTVRKATDNLVAKGLLSRVAGVGTFVCHPAVTLNPSSVQGFSQVMAQQGITVRTELPSFMLQNAPANIASILDIETGEPIYFIERIRYADEKIFQFETTYMSSRLYPDISIQVLQESKYQYFEKIKGLKIAYSHHIVTPLHPSKRIADLFDIPLDTPILRVANTTYLTNGQVMDYTELTLNSPKYQLTYIKK
ncbi:MAG: GntR family transcriptional regulator [Lachnospiraceae bacterium]|jgi:DNA-binding GntR family transcriptional regulator|nr:GntR family transcriptional regulator [Lachnospiraceae bacterium]